MKKALALILCLLLALSSATLCFAEESITGKYAGTSSGMWGDITVDVTLDNGTITDVAVTSSADTAQIMAAATEDITKKIIGTQSVKVDATAGATISSYGVIYAVRDALTEAGVLDSFMIDVLAAPDKTEGASEDYDIVVVGGGGSGLTAAAYAKQAGANSVLVLEKMPWTGGSTSISGGGGIVLGSRYNELAGVDASVQEYLDFFINAAKNAENRPEGMWINEDLVRKIGEVTGSTFDTFMDAGFPFPDEFWSNPYNAAVWGSWGVEGRGLISFNYDAGELYSKWLTQYAKDNGAEIRTSSSVIELLSASGSVNGVKVEGPDSIYTVNAKKVILACGGMEANKELLEIYAPEAVGMSLYACPGNTGDFVALTEDLDVVMTGYGSVAQAGPDRGHSSATGASLLGLSLMVNTDGERFMDEDVKYYKRARGVNAQKGNFAWGIADGNNPFAAGLEAELGNGNTFKADTLEELAEMIGVPAGALVASTEELHAEYLADKDPLNRALGACAKYDVSQAPYYAQSVYPLLMFTLTGLKLDAQCHVLNSSDEVIPNLYAVGEIAFGNCFFDEYVCGSCAVQIAVNTGRIAGESAAIEIAG